MYRRVLFNCNVINRIYSTKRRTFKEVNIPVPWGYIAGKWWEPFDGNPILSLHGLQDNCGAFNRLIPLLTKNVGFLTIDLPGHGRSSKLPSGMFYNLMNYVIVIKYISNHFKWLKFSLMGHSYGGIISVVYTMLNQDEINFVISIDGLKPYIVENNVQKLAESVKNFIRYDHYTMNTEKAPIYEMQELEKLLSLYNNQSINVEQCHHILERNTLPSKQDANKYYFSRDPKLRLYLDINWSQEELEENSKRITKPILVFKHLGYGYREKKENYHRFLDIVSKSSEDCEFHHLQGKHHEILNNPENFSDIINNFIRKYNIL